MKRRMFLVPLLLLGLTACLPIPDVRVGLNLPPPSYRFPPDQVRTEYVQLPGYPAPRTPERYNRTFYLRYFVPNKPADTVLILAPGLFGGASTFHILAQQLVASIPGLEVWAVDRRANALEDRSAFIESLRERDPAIAYEFYVERAGEEGGFVATPPSSLHFMAFWGLDVHLRDLHRIVERAQATAKTIILGGHSLGASSVSLYAAYDFGQGTRDPGYRHIDGLLLLDGALGRTGAFSYETGGISIGPIELVASIAELEAGEGDPYLTFEFGPYNRAEAEAKALLAHFEPEALSPGGFVDYPATNMAVVGVLNDDHYNTSVTFGVSMGEPVGAKFGGNLTAVVLDGLEGVYSQSVSGVAKNYDNVGWTRGDLKREYTDPSALVAAWTLPETNHNEWYFPVRLLLDIMQLEPRLAEEQGFVANAEVLAPTLALGAERGLVQNLEGFSTYANVRPGALLSSYVLPGFTHVDITSAEQNPVVPLFASWLRRLRKQT